MDHARPRVSLISCLGICDRVSHPAAPALTVVQGWLRNVEKGGAQREMENFEVALDGNIIAREPNGDVIQMDVPGWQVR